ncbi:amino acid ABC transporter ATP-binding protein, PAAT family [Bradyrhizobium lablabi]|jgi:polar amino acid transport system ATP-binding protein|uniref:Amino acid ABC transporter ATP-binding protein, PAAT family n=1 Tax=Bradyrhizobium lablabi TaxID=722472 RepID=A0A1M6JZA5_9BRAD|nr:amino acid ABC transporter ATP-binding protein [Bradyrhizobium lablabi]SHJ52039.1 amino acid ABC transporter ATP-binding protein, PAAT family [Bradyrhizobium lablabi]
MAQSSKVLDVAGVSKRFGDVEVLCDVSFKVDKGETICVLGPSGSGKSTLLRCINWLERPDAGQIYLNGEQVGINGAGIVMGDRDLSKIRTRIGMVFQHFALWPHLTVLQNLMEAPVQVQKRPKAEVRDEALALLSKVGLLEKRDAFPAKLSGGQKQRVGIARALAMRPDLLLFDEPTSALDPELVGEVLVVMRDLAREGMTMVIVTHEMGFAREAATRVLFLDRGRVVETGSPDRFFSDPETERARQFLQRYAGDTANGRR